MPSDVDSELYLRNHRKHYKYIDSMAWGPTHRCPQETAFPSSWTHRIDFNQYKSLPLGRFAELHEMAGQAILFLSYYVSYMTGRQYFVNGHVVFQDQFQPHTPGSDMTLDLISGDAERRSESQCDRDERRQKTKIAARCTRSLDNPRGT
ncbi:hypothetical protein BDQ17DRAFT_821571 [Cyathus striatus]|nr:hypothetical protein BDQ17DRAFT_821571 [Cyathus striatus]